MGVVDAGLPRVGPYGLEAEVTVAADALIIVLYQSLLGMNLGGEASQLTLLPAPGADEM